MEPKAQRFELRHRCVTWRKGNSNGGRWMGPFPSLGESKSLRTYKRRPKRQIGHPQNWWFVEGQPLPKCPYGRRYMLFFLLKLGDRIVSNIYKKEASRWCGNVGIPAKMNNEKRPSGCLGFLGDEILPSDIGIMINHYKDLD